MKLHRCFIILFCLVTTISCSGTKVSRSGENDVTDLSGNWNELDSKLVSEHMTENLLEDAWSKTFFNKYGRRPVVAIGKVLNKTSEHISTKTFIRDIELALQTSDRVDLVASGEVKKEIRQEREDYHDNNLHPGGTRIYQEKEIDFLLSGTIHSVEDQVQDLKTVYYQVDLELVSVATNEKIWIGQKRIKKVIEKPLIKW